MELHHKLRRDPSWHPSACNICGQIYGDDAFRLKTPLYESDYQRMRKEKEIDFEALAKRAKEYAESNKAAEFVAGAANVQQPQAAVAPAAAASEAAVPAASEAKDEVPPLPEGWAEAKDAQERTYYWHTVTKKVQWERPTAETPIE